MSRLRKVALALSWCVAIGVSANSHAVVAFATLESASPEDLQRLVMTVPERDRGRVLTAIGRNLIDGDLAATRVVLDRAQASLLADDLAGQAVLAALRCIEHIMLGDMPAARRLCDTAQAQAEASQNDYALAKAHGAASQWFYQGGDITPAVEHGLLAIEAAERTGNNRLLSVQYNNHGLVVRAQGRYRNAVEYFRKSLALIDSSVDENRFYTFSFNMGLTYADLGEHELALDFYRPTHQWARKQNKYSKELIGVVYIALSEIALGNASGAERALRAALARDELTVNQGYLAFAYATLGKAMFVQGDILAARECYERGIALAATVPNTFEQRLVDLGYAEVLAADGEVGRSLIILESAIADLRREGSIKPLLAALQMQTQLRQQQGDLPGSMRSFEELAAVMQEVQRDEMEYELAIARAAYEVDRKERELLAAESESNVRNGAILMLIAFGLIGYLYVTRRTEAKQRLTQHQLALKLEEEVAQRTAELQERMAQIESAESARREIEQQLAEADKLRVLGQLTGGVAHDFNNLLTVISGAAEVLRLGVDARKTEDLIQHIIDAAASGADITKALMAYARQQPLRLEVVDLAAFMHERMPLLARALGGNTAVSLDMDNQLRALVKLDQAQLTAALLNLCLNARDALGGQGDIRVAVNLRNSSAVLVSVVDQGVGMTEEEKQKAVEPFYTTKRDKHGNGLGLSMVYGFTKQIGGDLEIVSRQGQGTTVSLILPLIVEGAHVADKAEADTGDADNKVVALPVQRQGSV